MNRGLVFLNKNRVFLNSFTRTSNLSHLTSRMERYAMSREPFVSKDPSFVTLSDWNNVTAGFTTRTGGVSSEPYDSFNLGFHVGDDPISVLENRRRLAEKVGVPLERWVCTEQVHGSNIRKVTVGGKGAEGLENAIPATDGIYTSKAGLLLALGYADCVPLYFYAPNSRIVGIAHAGWRGTVQNIGGNMVERWVNEEGVPREEIYTAIGPSIGACCYEVDRHVIDAVDEALGSEAQAVYRQTDEAHWRLDLKECNRKLLIRAGISEDHIECSSYCTGCRTDLFYSHRKENGHTGRMLGFIVVDNQE